MRSAALAPRVTLADILWWALASLAAVLAAALVWALVEPLGPLGAWHPRGPRIASPAARALLFASVDPFNRGVAPAAQGQSVTALTLVLYGTRGLPGGGGTAIIAGADGRQQLYTTGEAVAPGVTLTGVAFDHVTLAHNGASETLYIDQSKAAPQAGAVVAANPVGAPPAQPAALTADAVKSGIAFAPGGGGVAVRAQGDGTVFRNAGFQPGDVIVAVNGKPPRDAAALAGSIRPGATVPVTVRRNGQDLPLAIPVAP